MKDKTDEHRFARRKNKFYPTAGRRRFGDGAGASGPDRQQKPFSGDGFGLFGGTVAAAAGDAAAATGLRFHGTALLSRGNSRLLVSNRNPQHKKSGDEPAADETA